MSTQYNGPTYGTGTGTASDRPEVNKSLGELLGEVTTDISTLMRQEVALAKAEMKQEATKTGKAAGMMGAAGYAGHFVVLFLSFAAWWGLSELIGDHIATAALIVAIVWAVIAGVLFVMGRKKLKEVRGPEQTVDTLKEIPDTLKPGTGPTERTI